MARNCSPSRWPGADETGESGCEIDWAGDMGTTMGTVMDWPMGTAMVCPAGWAADSPRPPPGAWRVVCACNATGSRQAAAAAVITGRMEGFFIGVLSRGTPGARTHSLMLCMVA